MKTADLCDKYGDLLVLHVLEPLGFKNFGGRAEFHGQIETVKCYEDNTFVRAALEKDGTDKVLVVDGGGSSRCALLGDNIADLAHRNHWKGIIVFGCIRDSAAVSKMEIGVLALGTNPQKSAKEKAGEVNIIVSFADVDFIPGEYVYIDEDGAVVSAKELVL
jgi:regulator of ribonuclease activity A